MLRLLTRCFFATLVVAGALPAAEKAGGTNEESLAQRHRRFLEEVDLLIGAEERQAFLSLSQDYQRDRFLRRFWRVRDPFPRTPRNEFRDLWEENAKVARLRFDDLSDVRAQMILFFGPEKRSFRVSCTDLLQPLDIWYFDAIPTVRPVFYLVFQRLGSNNVRLWNPRDGIEALRTPGVSVLTDPTSFLRQVSEHCSRGDEIATALLASVDWEELAEQLALRTEVATEWVQTFLSRSTDLPDGVQLLPAEVSWDFPGTHQSRTVVQLILSVKRSAARLGVLGGRAAYNFLVDGEILRRGEFFESFRYKFDIPAPEDEADPPTDPRLPLAAQRYLRPGLYTWIVKLQDLNAKTFFRQDMEIEVPNLRLANAAPQTASAPQSSSEPDGELELWGEANAALEDSPLGDHTLKLQAPTDRLLTGRIRVVAQTTGGDIAKVAFSLNGKPVMAKSRSPYSVELNLGRAPRMHTLAATALNADARRLASDEVILNAGPHRFGIRLIEPQRGHRYSRSVRARAEVDLPRNEVLDRVEFYLNEDRVATLYQKPFVQPILIPENQDLAFVRAVAFLSGGNWTEDLVFVNSPDPIDSVEVNLVELYVSVFDGRDRPAEDLVQADFTVLEDGVEQEIRRFAAVKERPIHAGILLDISTSMSDSLEEAEKAALRFFESVIREQDRASLITFNDQPELVVPFTNELGVLAGGLAGLVAEGETALYDSLIFALHYFNGLRGKRALILISDGEDSSSEYRFDEVLEFARHAGVAIYTVGLQIPTRRTRERSMLLRLARETGGRTFFIETAQELRSVYEKVENDLRSQYLITYQSSQTGGEDRFREIELRVHPKGLRTKTRRGYYP